MQHSLSPSLLSLQLFLFVCLLIVWHTKGVAAPRAGALLQHQLVSSHPGFPLAQRRETAAVVVVVNTEAEEDNRCVKGLCSNKPFEGFRQSEYRLFSCKLFFSPGKGPDPFTCSCSALNKAENTAAPRLQSWEWSPRTTHNHICWILVWLLQRNK